MFKWIKNLISPEPTIHTAGSSKSLVDRVFADSMCPVCETKNSLLAGPSGGMSINVMCGCCGTRLNITPALNRIEWTHGPQPQIWGGKAAKMFPDADLVVDVRNLLEAEQR